LQINIFQDVSRKNRNRQLAITKFMFKCFGLSDPSRLLMPLWWCD
jgi:hypothetical protein